MMTEQVNIPYVLRFTREVPLASAQQWLTNLPSAVLK